MERIIGTYSENKKGPLLVVIGGIHGNEPAGIKAIDLIGMMLEVEHIKNPKFNYYGRFMGIIGNLAARKLNQRFINKDLNRHWSDEHVRKIRALPSDQLDSEDLEMLAVIDLINDELNKFEYTELVVLDLHTTSSHGGIFVIPNDTKDSLEIALELHAPVIKGMLQGIKGTTLHYFNNKNFPIKTTAVTFESGQHQDPLSVNRAIAGIINCMRTIEAVPASDVENFHDKILKKFSKSLPKCSYLIDRYDIQPNSEFRMLPGYKNFQRVKKGEVIAKDANGDIVVSDDGMLLMPLYQKQGEDGFFIIQEADQQ